MSHVRCFNNTAAEKKNRKKLIRKALDMIRKIAEEDPDESTDKDKKGICDALAISLGNYHDLYQWQWNVPWLLIGTVARHGVFFVSS